MSEQWTTEQVAQFLGAASIQSASRTLHRWGVTPVGRQPGKGGQNLYDADTVREAKKNAPGRGKGGGRPWPKRTAPDGN